MRALRRTPACGPTNRGRWTSASGIRSSIDRWFYPCSPQIHCSLADLWEADRRYAQNIDKHGAGLTEYLAAAVRANAKRTPS